MEMDPLNIYLQKEFLYDELLCGFVSFSPNGKILSINKTMVNWIGIDHSEVKHRSLKSLMTESSLIYYKRVVEPLLNDNSVVNEISLTFLTLGESFEALFSARSYKDDDGRIFLINATIQKVAERNKYENALLKEKQHAENEHRKFEFLFNSAPNHIWTSDPTGKILTINQKVKDYFGIEKPSEPHGMNGVFESDRKRTFNAVKKGSATGKVFERELRLVGLSGFPEWFLVKAEPFFNEEGSIEMWFCTGTNINKQKLQQIASQAALESDLSSAYKTLDKNAELFVTIALNQSHMIRKPVANILGLGRILEEECLDGEFKDIVKMLLNSILELDDMIKRGLDGTRIS